MKTIKTLKTGFILVSGSVTKIKTKTSEARQKTISTNTLLIY
jgi:hypothetical protein